VHSESQWSGSGVRPGGSEGKDRMGEWRKGGPRRFLSDRGEMDPVMEKEGEATGNEDSSKRELEIFVLPLEGS
jgi:hypothetical protein